MPLRAAFNRWTHSNRRVQPKSSGQGKTLNGVAPPILGVCMLQLLANQGLWFHMFHLTYLVLPNFYQNTETETAIPLVRWLQSLQRIMANGTIGQVRGAGLAQDLWKTNTGRNSGSTPQQFKGHTNWAPLPPIIFSNFLRYRRQHLDKERMDPFLRFGLKSCVWRVCNLLTVS